MEEQEPNEENVNQPASPQPPEPASPQPPEPAGPQPPEPVKSQTTKVQETIDRNIAERAARQKTTDEVIAKRKLVAATDEGAAEADADALEQAAAVTSSEAETERKKQVVATIAKAALEALPGGEAVQAANDAVPIDQDAAVEKILADVMGKSKARELREIEMHNATMDAMMNQTNAMESLKEVHETMCNLLSYIAGNMKDIVGMFKNKR